MEEGGGRALSYGNRMTEILNYLGIVEGEHSSSNEVVVFLSRNHVSFIFVVQYPAKVGIVRSFCLTF